MLEGEYAGDSPRREPNDAEPVVVFAGRHIREKRAPPPCRAAVAEARAPRGDLRGAVFGDGPERGDVPPGDRRRGRGSFVSAPGFVDHEVLDRALRERAVHGAAVLARGLRHGRRRGGSKGTPSIVVEGSDNAAVELVEDGVNGVVAASREPGELAAAIVRGTPTAAALRERNMRVVRRNGERLSLERSLRQVVGAYARWDSARS